MLTTTICYRITIWKFAFESEIQQIHFNKWFNITEGTEDRYERQDDSYNMFQYTGIFKWTDWDVF